jgi:hypothetical protein
MPNKNNFQDDDLGLLLHLFPSFFLHYISSLAGLSGAYKGRISKTL